VKLKPGELLVPGAAVLDLKTLLRTDLCSCGMGIMTFPDALVHSPSHVDSVALCRLAAAGHAVLGHVDLRALACLLVGSIPGVLLATRAAIRLPPQLTRALIAIMLIVVSERLFSA
jgi:uncharacterized membrane protein YfcA